MLDELTRPEMQTNAVGRLAGKGYTLARALGIVHAMETSILRTAVFDEIKRKNRFVRLADWMYAAGNASLIRRAMLALYMLKTVAAIGPAPAQSAQVMTVSGFANEVRAIERVTQFMPEIDIADTRISRSNLTTRGQARALLKTLGLIAARWRFLGRLARREDFMPACRMVSALACYARFSDILVQSPDIRGTVVASNYSPDALGLAAAAHKAKRFVAYVNHAPVPQNSPYVPPVYADLALFNGAAMHDTYLSRSACHTNPVFIGQEGSTSPMRFADTVRSVGIFLTALTRVETIERLVGDIRRAYPDAGILIRHHPVALLETDLSILEATTSGLRVTLGTPLEEDIAACDAVICGNSGVTLNILRAGCPVGYLPELDDLPLDYNGFLERGLVALLDDWTPESYQRMRAFYERPEWIGVMRRFDASYLMEHDALGQAARSALNGILSGQAPAQHSRSPSVERLVSREAVVPGA